MTSFAQAFYALDIVSRPPRHHHWLDMSSPFGGLFDAIRGLGEDGDSVMLQTTTKRHQD